MCEDVIVLSGENMKERKTLSLSKELVNEIEELRWRERFESYSQAVEFVLKQGMSALATRKALLEDEGVKEERKLNNRFYEKIRLRLLREHSGEYVIIAKGELLGTARRFDEALEILRLKASGVSHAIVDKVGEEAETVGVWEDFLEKVK